jgi:hypothetical protein
VNYAENRRLLAEFSGDSALEDDPDFNAALDEIIVSAENRILRDLDLLSTRVPDDSGKLTQNRKIFVLPKDVGTYIVLEQLRVISAPDGIYGPPLLPTTKDFIDTMFPDENAPTSPSVPIYWCPLDQATVGIAPPPDQNYFMACWGTMRPAPLSPKTPNPGTFISTQMRDLFFAAEMLQSNAWQRNWSARSDDPRASVNWLDEYQRLKNPALVEEFRKKLMSSGWSSRLPNPLTAAQSSAPPSQQG